MYFRTVNGKVNIAVNLPESQKGDFTLIFRPLKGGDIQRYAELKKAGAGEQEIFQELSPGYHINSPAWQ